MANKKLHRWPAIMTMVGGLVVATGSPAHAGALEAATAKTHDGAASGSPAFECEPLQAKKAAPHKARPAAKKPPPALQTAAKPASRPPVRSTGTPRTTPVKHRRRQPTGPEALVRAQQVCHQVLPPADLQVDVPPIDDVVLDTDPSLEEGVAQLANLVTDLNTMTPCIDAPCELLAGNPMLPSGGVGGGPGTVIHAPGGGGLIPPASSSGGGSSGGGSSSGGGPEGGGSSSSGGSSGGASSGGSSGGGIPVEVPEPGSARLALLGLAALFAGRRLRRR